MSVNSNVDGLDGHVADVPPGRAMQKRPQAQQAAPRHDPHTIRFGRLAALCLALGQRGFTSTLVHPGLGEAVLCVPFSHRPETRLMVGAVESGGRWMFTYGGRWSPVDDLAGTAVRIITMVTA